MRVGFEVYLQFYFASLYNLRNASFEDFAEYFSVIVSIIWQILLVFLLISVFIILFKFKRNYNEEEIKDSRVHILLEEFKDNNKYLIVDHIIFLLRRTFLSILIIFGWGYGLFQGCIFFMICLGVLISKIVLRPFKSSILNVQGVVFEFILWIVIGLLASFYNITL